MGIFISLLAISFLIFFHELGHFIVAKIFGVRVRVFSIGFGKKIASFNFKGTMYALSAIPLGGYVKLKSRFEDKKEQDISHIEDIHVKKDFAKNDCLEDKHHLIRILILLAGPFFNFFLAFIIFSALYLNGIKAPINEPIIGSVDPIFPSYKLLKPNDLILQVEDKKINSFNNIRLALNPKGQDPSLNIKEIKMQVLRDSKKLDLLVPARFENGFYMLGIAQSFSMINYGLLDSINLGLDRAMHFSYLILKGIKDLILGALSIKNIGSVVGMTEFSANAYEVNISSYFLVVGVISINLFILNLLPIPMLDGGQILFTLYEWIFKKQVPSNLNRILIGIGIAFLISLSLVGVFNDLSRIFGF